MDSWSDVQLSKMHSGGNTQCLEFLNQHGIDSSQRIKERYDCAASYLYQQVLQARREGKPEPTELPKMPEDSTPMRKAKMKLEGFGSSPMEPEQERQWTFKRFSRSISFQDQESKDDAEAAAAAAANGAEDENIFTRWGRSLAAQVIQDEEAKAKKAKKEDQDLQEEEEDVFNIDDIVNQIVEQHDEGFSDRWSQVQKESVVERKEPENLFSRWSRSWSSPVNAQGPIKVKEESDAEEGKEDELDEIEKEGEKNADDNDVKEKQNDDQAVEADQEETAALNDEPQERSEFFRRVSQTFSSSTLGSRMKTDSDDGDGEEEEALNAERQERQGFLRRVSRTFSASTQGSRMSSHDEDAEESLRGEETQVRPTWSSSTQGSRIQGDETKLVGEDENDASVPKEIQTTVVVEASKDDDQVEDQQEKANEKIGDREETQSDVEPAAEQIGEKEVESSDIEPTA
jgi:hypothetical protein